MTEENYFFEFDCPICEKVDTVHFEPKRPEELICRDCLAEHGLGHDFSKVINSPRRKHHTNVAFPIVCMECAKEEILDYVPKGVPMHELKCEDCMQSSLPDSKWSEISRLKDRERDKKFTIQCEKCKCDWQIPFKPREGKRYRCDTCFDENDQEYGSDITNNDEIEEPKNEWQVRDGFRVRKKRNLDE